MWFTDRGAFLPLSKPVSRSVRMLQNAVPSRHNLRWIHDSIQNSNLAFCFRQEGEIELPERRLAVDWPAVAALAMDAVTGREDDGPTAYAEPGAQGLRIADSNSRIASAIPEVLTSTPIALWPAACVNDSLWRSLQCPAGMAAAVSPTWSAAPALHGVLFRTRARSAGKR